MVDADGTVHIPAFAVPLPRHMSGEAKQQFIEEPHNPSLEQALRKRTGGDPNAPIDKVRAAVTISTAQLSSALGRYIPSISRIESLEASGHRS